MKLSHQPILSEVQAVQPLTADLCISEIAAAGCGICTNEGIKRGAVHWTPLCGVTAWRIGMLGRSKFGIDFHFEAEHIISVKPSIHSTSHSEMVLDPVLQGCVDIAPASLLSVCFFEWLPCHVMACTTSAFELHDVRFSVRASAS